MKRGFTIFFAVLVASLALAIGLAIYDITARQIELSATASQSQYAIYAADSGVECALFWDNFSQASVGSAFGTSSASTWPAGGSGELCEQQDISTLWGVPQKSASSATTTFTLSLGSSGCATVSVMKATVGSILYTTIDSHGYNTCTSGAQNLVEREFQVTY